MICESNRDGFDAFIKSSSDIKNIELQTKGSFAVQSHHASLFLT